MAAVRGPPHVLVAAAVAPAAAVRRHRRAVYHKHHLVPDPHSLRHKHCPLGTERGRLGGLVMECSGVIRYLTPLCVNEVVVQY